MSDDPDDNIVKLPAVQKDREAYAFARRMLQGFRDTSSPWSSESALSPQAGRGFFRDILARSVRSAYVNLRLQVLAAARAGDDDAIFVVNHFINDMKSLGVQLPTEFAAYSMDVVAGLVRPRGPRPKESLARNIVIANTVAALIDRFGIPYSRKRKGRDGRPSARRSGSAIVAAAARDVTGGQLDLGEKRVERVYETMRGGMPNSAGLDAGDLRQILKKEQKKPVPLELKGPNLCMMGDRFNQNRRPHIMTTNGNRPGKGAAKSVGNHPNATENSRTTRQAQATQVGMRYSITSYRNRDCYVLAISAHPGLSATEKLALIRLAHHVNFRTGRCNPAAATLAKELGKDERWIRRTLAGLERAGLLAIDRTRGRTSNNFTLMVPSNPGQDARVEPANPGENTRVQPGSKRSPTRVKMDSNPGQLAPLTAKRTAKRTEEREKSNSPDFFGGVKKEAAAKEENKIETEDADAFARFWSAYPKHAGKLDAEKAFKAALKTTDAETIIAGAERYAGERAGQEPRYTKHPGTWLRAGCWGDEPARSNGHTVIDQHGNVITTPRTGEWTWGDVQARALALLGGPRS